jgi:hypothetical protein
MTTINLQALMMKKVINIVKQEDQDVQYIVFWLSRSPEERLAEVTRLRQNYFKWLHGVFPEKIEKVVQKRML